MFLLLMGPHDSRGLHYGYLLSSQAVAQYQTAFPDAHDWAAKLFEALSPLRCSTGEAIRMTSAQWHAVGRTINAEVRGPGDLVSLFNTRGEGIGHV